MITKEEWRKIESSVRREEWLEKGCPFFKGGTHKDKKKEKDKKKCRRKNYQEGWE